MAANEDNNYVVPMSMDPHDENPDDVPIDLDDLDD